MRYLKRFVAILAFAGAGVGVYLYANRPPTELVLTGIVTTNDVLVAPQIGGRLNEVFVKEGDPVTRNQLLAVIAPNLLVKPYTMMFNKVTIKNAKQAVQMFGPAQHGVAKAVAAHDSPGYKAALAALAGGCKRDMRIVEGV